MIGRVCLVDKLRRHLRGRVNLLDYSGGSIRAALGKSAHVAGLEAKTDDSVPTARLRLGYNPADRIISCRIELIYSEKQQSLYDQEYKIKYVPCL